MVVELVNPPLTEAKRRRSQPQQAQVRIDLLKVADNLLILAVIIVADAVALVDDQQRKLALKLVEVAGDRLHAAKDHFTVALFTLEARGENIRFQAERAILGVVLRHQLFNVRQHQHATARQARKFGDNQAFTCACRQHNRSRFMMAAKPGERRVDRLFLVGT